MKLHELIEALHDLKQSGKEVSNDPVIFIDESGVEHEINKVVRFQYVFGQIELSE